MAKGHKLSLTDFSQFEQREISKIDGEIKSGLGIRLIYD